MLWQFWVFLWFHINFMITCSSSVKNVMGNLIVCGCGHTQLCLTLCNPMDCSPPGSFVHEISQAVILEWVAISFSKGSSQPRAQTHISCNTFGYLVITARRYWRTAVCQAGILKLFVLFLSVTSRPTKCCSFPFLKTEACACAKHLGMAS